MKSKKSLKSKKKTPKPKTSLQTKKKKVSIDYGEFSDWKGPHF